MYHVSIKIPHFRSSKGFFELHGAKVVAWMAFNKEAWMVDTYPYCTYTFVDTCGRQQQTTSTNQAVEGGGK